VDRRTDSDHDITGPVTTAGTRYVAWFGRMRSPTEILQVDQPKLVRTRFGSWLLRGVQEVTFEEQDQGTRLTQEFWTNGIISAVMGRIFAFGSYKGQLPGRTQLLRSAGGAGSRFGLISSFDDNLARRPADAEPLVSLR
jgi:hypothetical protein